MSLKNKFLRSTTRGAVKLGGGLKQAPEVGLKLFFVWRANFQNLQGPRRHFKALVFAANHEIGPLNIREKYRYQRHSVTYHVVRCVQEGVSDEEFFEAFNVALIVGGSITIPHVRRAADTLDQCIEKQSKGQSIEL